MATARVSMKLVAPYLAALALGLGAGALGYRLVTPPIPDLEARARVPGARVETALIELNDRIAAGDAVIDLVCASWTCAPAGASHSGPEGAP